jgi:hypothetical protein
MLENIKEGDFVTLKLMSGEEVIATYLGSDNNASLTPSGYIKIKKALVLMQSPQGLAFGTFFSTAKQDEPFKIARDKITTIAHINDKIKQEYERVFSTIKTVEKPKIIT